MIFFLGRNEKKHLATKTAYEYLPLEVITSLCARLSPKAMNWHYYLNSDIAGQIKLSFRNVILHLRLRYFQTCQVFGIVRDLHAFSCQTRILARLLQNRLVVPHFLICCFEV